MNIINDYIDNSLMNMKENKYLERFKKEILADMTGRANELTQTGLNNDKVINDLLFSEHLDLSAEYRKYVEEIKHKRNNRNKKLISSLSVLLYSLIVISVYLLISFTSEKWSVTWLFPFSMFTFLLVFFFIRRIIINSNNKSLFQPASRILLAVTTYLLATVLFVNVLVLTDYDKPWIIFIVNVAFMQIIDLVYSKLTNQRFTLIYSLLYMIPISAIVYITLALLGIITWKLGWLIIIIGILIDLVIIILRIIINNNSGFDEEVEYE